MNVYRADCALVMLLALIFMGWLVLGVLSIGLLNVAKWMVFSASRARPAAPATSGSWPSPRPSLTDPFGMPRPFGASAVAARQDGVSPHPTR